ncbi:glycosyltransferase family A protein [Butyrivibrio sp. FC2001]|uniref:glycosyltransferase family A protein n=1 Tax=Butyrivibrio sp. FC2001 TaxID=1280671 RepID=UPI000685BFEC|nr:glycosyltransferase family A protein [Butyrivibrio sp. FC2001]
MTYSRRENKIYNNNLNAVSIIMPTYNRANTIGRAINSVLSQSYKYFELIVVDDGSNDGTEELIMKIRDKRIRYIKNKKNSGACYARNVGMANANYNYIAFLDSDNVWREEYLFCRMSALLEMPDDVGGVFGTTTLVNGDNEEEFPSKEICERMVSYYDNEYFLKEMLYGNVIDTNTIVIKRQAIEGIGGFNIVLKRLQDWEYFFRVLLHTKYKIRFIYDSLAINYLQNDSLGKSEKEYWKSLIFFYGTYKQEYKKRNCWYECITNQFTNQRVKADKQDIAGLVELLDENEREEAIFFFQRKMYEKESENIRYWQDNLNLWGENAKLIEENIALNDRLTRNIKLRNVLNNWILLAQRGVTIKTFLEKNDYHNVVIYGYGILGKILKNELTKYDYKISGIIDRKIEEGKIDSIPIYNALDNSLNSDAIIVTAVSDFDEIKNTIAHNNVFSLENILDYLFLGINE